MKLLKKKKKKKNPTAILHSNNHLEQFHRVRKESARTPCVILTLCNFLVGSKCPCSSAVSSASSSLSRVWICVAPLTVARQAPPSMGFSRQEYWSGLPWPPPGDLPNPGIESRSPACQGDSLLLSNHGRGWVFSLLSIHSDSSHWGYPWARPWQNCTTFMQVIACSSFKTFFQEGILDQSK